MLTSKQRAFLRGMANGMDAIFQVGKNGVTPELRDTVYNALEARELVKISVLDNNMLGAREAAEMLAGMLAEAGVKNTVVYDVSSTHVSYPCGEKACHRAAAGKEIRTRNRQRGKKEQR